MEEMFFGMFLGVMAGALLVILIVQPWQPGNQMECAPGYHAVQTSSELHHRGYGCQPITP